LFFNARANQKIPNLALGRESTVALPNAPLKCLARRASTTFRRAIEVQISSGPTGAPNLAYKWPELLILQPHEASWVSGEASGFLVKQYHSGVQDCHDTEFT
jgi:hypothetical protein